MLAKKGWFLKEIKFSQKGSQLFGLKPRMFKLIKQKTKNDAKKEMFDKGVQEKEVK